MSRIATSGSLCCWVIGTVAMVNLIGGASALGQVNSNAIPGAGTASGITLPSVPGLAQSGVLPVSPQVVPDRLQGLSLSPAAVPGDPKASMALRQNLASELTNGRRERVVPVPPALEIEVLDPNVDPLGNPAVRTIKDASGRTLVDIPPVVLVHRYYYTGDRSFQGPMLPGGPSIVVLHHPYTGERLYIETQMLPGAPRVLYTRSSVEYNYGPQAIILKFGHHGDPTVIYRQGTPFLEGLRHAREVRREKVDHWVQRAGIPQAYQYVQEGARNAAGASADGVRAAGRAIVSPVVQFIRATPLGTILTSDPARNAQREQDTMVQRAELQSRNLASDIPTNR